MNRNEMDRKLGEMVIDLYQAKADLADLEQKVIAQQQKVAVKKFLVTNLPTK